MEFGSHTNILYVACWSTPGLVRTSAQSAQIQWYIIMLPIKMATLYVGYTIHVQIWDTLIITDTLFHCLCKSIDTAWDGMNGGVRCVRCVRCWIPRFTTFWLLLMTSTSTLPAPQANYWASELDESTRYICILCVYIYLYIQTVTDTHTWYHIYIYYTFVHTYIHT